MRPLLRRITRNYAWGGWAPGMSECHFQLVFAQPFTCSLPARIQCLTWHKPLKLFFFGLQEANLHNFFWDGYWRLYLKGALSQAVSVTQANEYHFDGANSIETTNNWVYLVAKTWITWKLFKISNRILSSILKCDRAPLNSELFLHTAKNQLFFWLETRKASAFWF